MSDIANTNHRIPLDSTREKSPRHSRTPDRGCGDSAIDPDFQSLLDSCGRSGLWEEKSAISRNRQQLQVKTRDLAFQHYPTFIAAADCCQEISKDFKASQEQLSLMIDKIPKLVEACHSFKENVQKVSMHRKRTSMVLAKHPKLLEVLELPQLMDTCVKNGHHEEALAIQQLCGKLQKSLGNIPLIQNILETVHNSSLWMLNQLLGRLKCQIQLPECLKIIGYIRRMGAFNETQLRLKFLQARESYFSTALQQATSNLDGETSFSSDKKYAYLCRVIELTRICIFDAITQYRALFSDEDNIYGMSNSNTNNVVYRHIFPSWLSWKLNAFLEHFKANLDEDLDEQSVDSLIGQSMYFGQSLGRVGYDFRVLLVPVFLEIILKKSVGALKTGLRNVEIFAERGNSLEKYEEINISLNDNSNTKLNFYLLAEMCNAIIESCNKLRYSTPVIAQPIMILELQNFVEKSSEILKQIKSKMELKKGKNLTEKESKLFSELEEQFQLRIVPFCNKCKSLIFNEEETSNYLSKFTAKKDIELILEEIKIEPEEQIKQEEAEEKVFQNKTLSTTIQ